MIAAFLLLFTFAFSIIMLFLLAGVLPTEFEGFRQAVVSLTNTATSLDSGFPILAIGLMLIPVLSAYFVRSHPIFLIFSILGAFLDIFMAWLVKELFLAAMRTEPLLPYANQATFTVTVMQNLNILGMLFAGLTVLVLVFKAGE